jgi:hypothetical protein
MHLYTTSCSRRLRMLIAMVALALFAAFLLPPAFRLIAAQGIRPGMPTPPDSAQKDADKNERPQTDSRAAKRAQRIRNEKEFRDDVERLYQLATELREEVQQTPTAAVLSVPMIKKTEAIEKLAKQLKSKAKGE